jgi:hypothetical protein
VLDMHLDHVVGIAVVGKDRRLKGNAADRGIAAPFAKALAALARADTQIVESVVPAGILRESSILGIKPIGLHPADCVTFRFVKIETDPR